MYVVQHKASISCGHGHNVHWVLHRANHRRPPDNTETRRWSSAVPNHARRKSSTASVQLNIITTISLVVVVDFNCSDKVTGSYSRHQNQKWPCPLDKQHQSCNNKTSILHWMPVTLHQFLVYLIWDCDQTQYIPSPLPSCSLLLSKVNKNGS